MKKIILFSDLHHGNKKIIDGEKYNAPESSLNYLETILNKKNPDMIINLGDVINAENAHEDIRHLEEYIEFISKFESINLMGNHEMKNLSTEVLSKHGFLMKDFNMKIGNFLLLFVNTIYDNYDVRLKDDQIENLKNILSKEKNVIIFSHAPLCNFDISDNRWLSGRVEKAFIQNYKEFTDLFINWKGNAICVSGHLHEERYKDNGNVKFISIQSFAEVLTNNDGCPCCECIEIVFGDDIELRKVI